MAADVTKEKRAEEALLKAKAETELRQAVMVLAGSIAHDMTTPLVTVELFGKAVGEYMPVLIEAYWKAKAANISLDNDNFTEWKRAETLESLTAAGEIIPQETRRMINYIQVTLKQLSRVLKKELTKEDLVQCNIWSCIDDVISNYPFSGNEKEPIHLPDWDEKYKFNFMGNELLMYRILTNLITNSLYQIRKNQRGEIFINTEDGGEVNLLHFKDTAGGAPQEVIDHIFNGYKTTKGEGTGIGLAFCKQTMKSMGGDVICRSVYGDYIEFTLSFPKNSVNT